MFNAYDFCVVEVLHEHVCLWHFLGSHLAFLSHELSLKPKLNDWTTLSYQGTPKIHLSPPAQCWGYKNMSSHLSFCFVLFLSLVLGIEFRYFCLEEKYIMNRVFFKDIYTWLVNYLIIFFLNYLKIDPEEKCGAVLSATTGHSL